MKWLTPSLLLLSIGLNIVLMVHNQVILAHFEKNVVFDIDKVRADFYDEVRYVYRRGCINGADDYPQEYKNTYGFNVNSSVNWCNKQLDGLDQYLLEKTYNIGRKKRR